MAYLGASEPLRLIAWRKEEPGFHVGEVLPLAPEAAAVQQQLGTPYCYFAGSTEGCGCGFQLGEWDCIDDEQKARIRADLKALSDYLTTALERTKEIRVFASWADDEAGEPQHRRDLTPADLLRDDFYFLNAESSVFRRTSE